ncbi:MAG: hypothetical protein WC314_26905, partial [Vulcanimicrobiota bacterium]
RCVGVVAGIRYDMLSRSGYVLSQDGQELRSVPFAMAATLRDKTAFQLRQKPPLMRRISMHIMKRVFIVTLIHVFLLALMTPAAAQRRSPSHRGSRGHSKVTRSVQRAAPRHYSPGRARQTVRRAPRVQRSVQRAAPRRHNSSSRRQAPRVFTRDRTPTSTRPVTRLNLNRNRNINRNVNRNVNINRTRNVTRHVNVNQNRRIRVQPSNASHIRRVRVNSPNRYVRNRPVATYNRHRRHYYATPYPYAATYYNNPVFYNNYYARRRYRRFRNCPNVFLSLGFFLTRPYSYYDYARVGYYNPIIYGDDNYYRAPSVSANAEGGPTPDAVTAESESVAIAQPVPNAPTATPNSEEEKMLGVVSEYVEQRSQNELFEIKDAAFANQTWQLELAQAPAMFEIQDGLYSVVAGFEGTMATSTVPSNVNVEFFVAKSADGYQVKDAWITSANGIARNKVYQSPVYPDIKTWQAGQKCPFSGQPMVPIPPANTSEHG